MVLRWPGFLHNGPGASGGSSEILCLAHKENTHSNFLSGPLLVIAKNFQIKYLIILHVYMCVIGVTVRSDPVLIRSLS